MERITIDRQEQQPVPVAAPQRSKALSCLGWTLNIILVGTLLIVAGWIILTEAGVIETVYTRAPAAQEAPTTRPVATAVIRVVPMPQQQSEPQVQPTVAPAIQPVEQPAIVADDAPAQLEGAGTSFTRGLICYGGRYYIDGVGTEQDCSGSGGD